jgi:hypothetical protein
MAPWKLKVQIPAFMVVTLHPILSFSTLKKHIFYRGKPLHYQWSLDLETNQASLNFLSNFHPAGLSSTNKHEICWKLGL